MLVNARELCLQKINVRVKQMYLQGLKTLIGISKELLYTCTGAF